MGLALLSHADPREIGPDADPESIPDPRRILELLHAALDALEALGR